jgi:transcriptional regulator with XRE-family HTH domain
MSADTTRSDTDPALARLGQVVRELREKRGLSMEELAANCKIARWRLTRIEAGTLPSVDYGELCKLRDALDIGLDDLARKAEL